MDFTNGQCSRSGFVRDETFELHQAAGEGGSGDEGCTNIGLTVLSCLIVLVERWGLLVFNFQVMLAMNRRKRTNRNRKNKVNSINTNKKTNIQGCSFLDIDRFPFTFVFDVLTTLTLTVFLVLAFTNNVSARDGSGLVVYALSYIFYFIAGALSSRKLSNLTKNAVLKSLKRARQVAKPRQKQQHASSPKKKDGKHHTATVAAMTDSENEATEQQDSNNAEKEFEYEVRKLKKLAAAKVIQFSHAVTVLGIVAVVVVIIAGTASGFEPGLETWTSAFFIVAAIPCVGLIVLVSYHTYKTIKLVKSSMLYRQEKSQEKANTGYFHAGSSKQVLEMDRLILRLRIRLGLTSLVMIFPCIMLAQGLGALPINVGLAVFHHNAAFFSTLGALMLFKSPGCVICGINCSPFTSSSDTNSKVSDKNDKNGEKDEYHPNDMNDGTSMKDGHSTNDEGEPETSKAEKTLYDELSSSKEDANVSQSNNDSGMNDVEVRSSDNPLASEEGTASAA